MDSVDATLGVTLTALLVFAPIAFEKAPTGTDKAIALFGFALVILIVGRAPFFIRAPEPNPTIVAASSWAISMIPTTARSRKCGPRSVAGVLQHVRERRERRRAAAKAACDA